MWAALLLAARCAEAHNGYSLSISNPGQIAATRAVNLDPSHPEVARLGDGFTMMVWLRFNDMTSSRVQLNIAISSELDGNFFQPFGGLQGGYQFGGGGPAMASTLGADASTWHHYAQSWDASSGARAVYLDGQPLDSVASVSPNLSFLDQNAYMYIGMNCYPAYWDAEAHTTCNSAMSIDGEVDDVAVYARIMSPAEVATAATRSGRDLLDADSIFLYTFDDPTTEPGVVRNLGTASTGGNRDYDMVLGRFPKPPAADCLGTKFSPGSGATPRPALAPSAIPSSRALASLAVDPSAPYVVSARPGTTVTLIVAADGVDFTYAAPDDFSGTHLGTGTDGDGAVVAVHVVAGAPPGGSSHSVVGVEDTPVNVQLVGTSNFAPGNQLTPAISTLPSNGKVFATPHSSWPIGPS